MSVFTLIADYKLSLFLESFHQFGEGISTVSSQFSEDRSSLWLRFPVHEQSLWETSLSSSHVDYCRRYGEKSRIPFFFFFFLMENDGISLSPPCNWTISLCPEESMNRFIRVPIERIGKIRFQR